MKVENLNGYSNQFVIKDGLKLTFQSYKSQIAHLNEVFSLNAQDIILKLSLVGDMWDYSATTRRHFKSFINEHTPFTYENKQQWLKEIENNPSIEVI